MATNHKNFSTLCKTSHQPDFLIFVNVECTTNKRKQILFIEHQKMLIEITVCIPATLIKANCEDFSESSSSESDSDEESEDDEEPYCRDWGNSRRYDDDDDEPGAGGAATGGGGGGAYSSSSWFSSSSSSDTNRRTSSQRQGTTAQHSSGWSFNWVDLTATVVLAPWLILLAWSVIRKLYRLFKVSTKMKYSQHFYLQKLFY